MPLKKNAKHAHGTMTELNITPLLDLVFVLLVIFIITTPQLVNNLEMTLPSGKPPERNPNDPEPKINHIVVDENKRIFLNDEFVPEGTLVDKLKAIKASDPDPKVVVKGSDDVEYQGMVTVLDALQQLDITKVGLATQ